MEEYKNDIEEELLSCTKKRFAVVWNAIFPEEKIESSTVKDQDIREEFVDLISEELDFVEPELFAKIYNTLCEEKIKAEDLYI